MTSVNAQAIIDFETGAVFTVVQKQALLFLTDLCRIPWMKTGAHTDFSVQTNGRFFQREASPIVHQVPKQRLSVLHRRSPF